MGVSAHEDVAVELALHGCQRFQVSPRHHLVAMDDSDLEVANRDELRFGQSCYLYSGQGELRYLVEVALDDVCVGLG